MRQLLEARTLIEETSTEMRQFVAWTVFGLGLLLIPFGPKTLNDVALAVLVLANVVAGTRLHDDQLALIASTVFTAGCIYFGAASVAMLAYWCVIVAKTLDGI